MERAQETKTEEDYTKITNNYCFFNCFFYIYGDYRLCQFTARVLLNIPTFFLLGFKWFAVCQYIAKTSRLLSLLDNMA